MSEKLHAIADLIRDSENKRPTKTSARRVLNAGRILGLSDPELTGLMQLLGYANYETGDPYPELRMLRFWP